MPHQSRPIDPLIDLAPMSEMADRAGTNDERKLLIAVAAFAALALGMAVLAVAHHL